MRVQGEPGSFEVPGGWAALEGVGAAEFPALPEGTPETFRRSIVLGADTIPEDRDAAGYIALQEMLLAAALPGYAHIETAEVPAPPGSWRVVYQLEPADAEPMVQWQHYVFDGRRVAVLTATARDADPGDTESLLGAAATTFEFAPP